MCIFGIVRTYVATRHTIYLSYQSKTFRMRHFSHHSLPDSVGTRRILERVPDAPRGCQPPEVAGQGTQSRTVLQPRRASLLGRVSHGNDVGSVETVVVGNYAWIGQGVCLDKIDVVKRLGRKCSCVSSKNCDCNDDRCSVVWTLNYCEIIRTFLIQYLKVQITNISRVLYFFQDCLVSILSPNYHNEGYRAQDIYYEMFLF